MKNGGVRKWAPSELVARSTLGSSAAVHSAYGALATLHYVHFLVQQKRALEAAQSQSDGSSRRASRIKVVVPKGWTQRITLKLSCGTNTSSTRNLPGVEAVVYMPITPCEMFCYVMPSGACARSLVCVCASARAHARARV